MEFIYRGDGLSMAIPFFLKGGKPLEERHSGIPHNPFMVHCKAVLPRGDSPVFFQKHIPGRSIKEFVRKI